ncbi:MAG: hypothetical protein U0800_15320 [Isosphaeraceae bacterium]
MTVEAERSPEVDAEDTRKPSRQGQGGGPKTSFGKAASCTNATTHGLAARFRLPDVFQRQVNERMEHIVPRYQPRDDEDEFLCAQAAFGYARERRAMGEASRYLQIRSDRAQIYWHQDRWAEAAKLGGRLAKRPSEIAARLATSLHGARWMLDRWEHLRALLLMEVDGETDGVWVDETVAMAYDLLGIDPVLRDADPKRLAKGSREERLAVVDAEMDRLRELTTGDYLEHDKMLRMKAICGEAFMQDPYYQRLLRYAREGQLLHERSIQELERRRIARDLPAYAPDGTLLHPIDPPGTPPRPEPLPLPKEHIAFYEPFEPPAPPPTMTPPPREREPEQPREPAPAPPRPRLSPDEARRKVHEARQKQELDRRQAREEKARKRAERKALKAARARSRDR